MIRFIKNAILNVKNVMKEEMMKIIIVRNVKIITIMIIEIVI